MTTFVTAANQTTVDLFAAISAVARGAAQTITTTVSTVDMLDTFVQKELLKQKADAKIELADYADKAVKKAAVNSALFDAEIKGKLNTPELQSDFLKYQAKYAAVLNPTSTTTP